MVEWKQIPGYENYELSTDGQVRKTQIMKPSRRRDNYLHVSICGRQQLLHRLMALTFIGPCPAGKTQVCHKDGDHQNNDPTNLYWGTAQENGNDRIRHGRTIKGRKMPPPSAEQRARLSAALKGHPVSNETRAKISAANMGRKMPPWMPEHRAKLSAARTGRKLSDETREKLSAINKRRWEYFRMAHALLVAS